MPVVKFHSLPPLLLGFFGLLCTPTSKLLKENTYLMDLQEPGVTTETNSLRVSGLQTPATRFQVPP